MLSGPLVPLRVTLWPRQVAARLASPDDADTSKAAVAISVRSVVATTGVDLSARGRSNAVRLPAGAIRQSALSDRGLGWGRCPVRRCGYVVLARPVRRRRAIHGRGRDVETLGDLALELGDLHPRDD